jgi:Family of unknown function (DUF6065)
VAKLTCYAVAADPPRMVPARYGRQWMDDTSDRFAYRCLPLTIANAYGWEILCPCDFSATWNGGQRAEDITFKTSEQRDLAHVVVSHFNHGIITFHTGYLIRTDPEWDLMASAPVNQPKDGIMGLAGVIETDWLPFPFTMNYRFTRPGTIRFDKDEPFCLIVPQLKRALEAFEPEILSIDDAPELKREYETWRESRGDFIARLNQRDSETVKQAWQRFYFRGHKPGQEERVSQHVSKVRLATPVDRRKGKSTV